MNNKQRKILEKMLADPISKKLNYKDLESLLINIGCQIEQGNGSRVTIIYGKKIFKYHRPHPSPTVHPYAIKSFRLFLKVIGVIK